MKRFIILVKKCGDIEDELRKERCDLSANNIVSEASQLGCGSIARFMCMTTRGGELVLLKKKS